VGLLGVARLIQMKGAWSGHAMVLRPVVPAKREPLLVFQFDVVSGWDLLLLKDSTCVTVLGRKAK